MSGKMKMIDGTIYEGYFSNDLYNGYGKITMKETKRGMSNVNSLRYFEGIFLNGILPT